MSKVDKNDVATCLLVRIKQFQFVVACLVLHKRFSLSRHASKYLHSQETDLNTTVAVVEDLGAPCKSLRSTNELDKLISNASLFKYQVQTLVVAYSMLPK